MARLTSPKPRLTAPRPDLMATAPEAQKAHDRTRRQTLEYRKWYKTVRWQGLRKEVLSRDMYTCQQTGVALIGALHAPDSPVVDHIKPHEGDPDLFWDIDNLQAVCKSYHDSIKQAIEKADRTSSAHPKWLQPSAIPLTIVCGAPASGKSTYVKDHAHQFDIVIDLDVIASQISGEPQHGWNSSRWFNAAMHLRNNKLGDLSRATEGRAWFIVSEPQARHRDWWAATLKPERIIVMEVDEPTCMVRAANDPERDLRETEMHIMKWWALYDRRIGDVRVT